MSEQDFLTAIDQHQGIIIKICRIYRDHPEDREDCFQEILFQLWKSYPAFRAESKLSTWIYRIALNVALTDFRRRKVKVDYAAELPDSAEPVQSEMQASRHEWLMWAMRQLPEADRALLAMHLDDLSYREIAEVTGISENNIGVKLSRIRKRLLTLKNKTNYGT